MSSKKIILSALFSSTLVLSLSDHSFAATHVNKSHDYEVHVVSYPSGGVLVPFTVGGDLTMSISVQKSGKIIKKESLFAYVPSGKSFPFSFKFMTSNIKYYKNGKYAFSHTPATKEDYIYDARDIASYKVNYPNSNLSDTAKYKAIGYATYFSTATFPASFTVNTTEGAVD